MRFAATSCSFSGQRANSRVNSERSFSTHYGLERSMVVAEMSQAESMWHRDCWLRMERLVELPVRSTLVLDRTLFEIFNLSVDHGDELLGFLCGPLVPRMRFSPYADAASNEISWSRADCHRYHSPACRLWRAISTRIGPDVDTGISLSRDWILLSQIRSVQAGFRLNLECIFSSPKSLPVAIMIGNLVELSLVLSIVWMGRAGRLPADLEMFGRPWLRAADKSEAFSGTRESHRVREQVGPAPSMCPERRSRFEKHGGGIADSRFRVRSSMR